MTLDNKLKAIRMEVEVVKLGYPFLNSNRFTNYCSVF